MVSFIPPYTNPNILLLQYKKKGRSWEFFPDLFLTVQKSFSG